MLEHTTDYSTDVIKMTVWAYSASRATIIICKYKENEQNAYTRYLLLGKTAQSFLQKAGKLVNTLDRAGVAIVGT